MSPHVLTFTKTIFFRISLEILIHSHPLMNQIHTIPSHTLLFIKLTCKIDNYHIKSINTTLFNLK